MMETETALPVAKVVCQEDDTRRGQNLPSSLKNCANEEDNDQDSGTGGLSHAKSIEMDNDSKCMKTSRILILVCLLLTGVIAGGVTYYFVSKSETAYFDYEVSINCVDVWAVLQFAGCFVAVIMLLTSFLTWLFSCACRPTFLPTRSKNPSRTRPRDSEPS
jgi:hypothetical protein